MIPVEEHGTEGAAEKLGNAVLLIDKDPGMTSFDVVAAVKRAVGTRKAGHSGTLDRFASGLLVVCTGRATKLTRYFLGEKKRYSGTVSLGIRTDTDDATGAVLSEISAAHIGIEEIRRAASRYVGDIEQLPPSYSALKIGGKRASDIVRSGLTVDLKKRTVTVYDLAVTGFRPGGGAFDMEVECSKGTYIRSLARDIGNDLETGAHLSRLRRLESGRFSVNDAATLQELGKFMAGGQVGKNFILSPADALAGFSRIVVCNSARKKVLNGAIFPRDDVRTMSHGEKKMFAIFDEDQNVIAIADIDIEKWYITYLNTFHDVFSMKK